MKVLGYEWYVNLGGIGIYEPNMKLFKTKKEALEDALTFGYSSDMVSIDRVMSDGGSTYVISVKVAHVPAWKKIIEEQSP